MPHAITATDLKESKLQKVDQTSLSTLNHSWPVTEFYQPESFENVHNTLEM